MNAFVQPKNIGYLMTGLGALIALFAFLFVPFALEAVSYDMPTSFQSVQVAASATPVSKAPASAKGSTSGKPSTAVPASQATPAVQPLFTPQFNESASAWTITAAGSASGLAQVNGLLWLNLLLLLAMVAIVVLIVFKRTPFGLQTITIERQKFLGAVALVVLAMLCILIQGIVFAQATQTLRSRVSATENLGGAGIASLHQAAVQFNVGAWIFLLGMLAGVVGAGIPLLRQLPDQLASLKKLPFEDGSGPQPSVGQRAGAPLFQQPGTPKGPSQFYQQMSNQYAASQPGIAGYGADQQQENEQKKMSQFYPQVSGQHPAAQAYQPENAANVSGQFQAHVSGQYATPPQPQSASQNASGLFRQQGSGLFPAQPQQTFDESGAREAEGGNIWPDRPPRASL